MFDNWKEFTRKQYEYRKIERHIQRKQTDRIKMQMLYIWMTKCIHTEHRILIWMQKFSSIAPQLHMTLSQVLTTHSRSRAAAKNKNKGNRSNNTTSLYNSSNNSNSNSLLSNTNSNLLVTY